MKKKNIKNNDKFPKLTTLGFTLIELLAVILILGIIALIATPVIKSIIDESKMGVLKETTNNMLLNASNKCSKANLKNQSCPQNYVVNNGKLNNELSLKGKLPDRGSLTLYSNGEYIGYMYKDKYCAYTKDEKIKVEKISYEQCLTKISFPKLASDIVKAGDYIAYDAGKWNETISTSSLVSDDFGGYTVNNSKNDGIDCAANGSIVPSNSGWRVINTNKDNNVVQIVSAGTPECYNINTYGNIPYTIDILSNRSYSIYLNKEFASSVSILTKEQAESIEGNSISLGIDISNNLLKAGSKYYFPNISNTNTNHLLYVQPGGYVSGQGNGIAGIRPVVNLKSDVYITGGNGTKENPYTIKNYGNDSYKKPRLTGYWCNWNSENEDTTKNIATNLKLKDVPVYYSYVNVSFGTTDEGSQNGTINFSLDQYLSAHLGGYTKDEFISDIKMLKRRGQKVILSIGGSDGIITLNNNDDVNRFINSTELLIHEYGFDGIDIDIENDINTDNLEKAVKGIMNKHNENFILTFGIETADFYITKTSKPEGRYVNMIRNLKKYIDLVNIQIYNTGSQYGIDRNTYNPATLDFAMAMPNVLLEKGLREDQVGIGITPNQEKNGYVDPSIITSAYNSLKEGVCNECTSLKLPTSYPHFGGVMIWSINQDKFQNEKFGNVMKNIIK